MIITLPHGTDKLVRMDYLSTLLILLYNPYQDVQADLPVQNFYCAILCIH